MRTLSEVFGKRTVSVAAGARTASSQAPCRGCNGGGGCGGRGDCRPVLFVSRARTGHKGLGWNAWHSVNALRSIGIAAAAEQVEPAAVSDALRRCRPRVAIIMAFWLSTGEIERLAAEFPEITFVVKNHSGPQFLAQEAKGWESLFAIGDLASRRPNVRVAAIKGECVAALQAMGLPALALPNVYSPDEVAASPAPRKLPGFHVGLFGAYRPLKNAVGMACAVASAARRLGAPVTLHVNGTRAEFGAAQDATVIGEICRRAGVGLIHEGWLDHEPFKRLAGSMSVCLQASFSETYNYVAADCVTAGSPVVGSDAIYWLPRPWRVNPDSPEAIAAAILSSRHWDPAAGRRALAQDNARSLAGLTQTLRALGCTAPETRLQTGVAPAAGLL